MKRSHLRAHTARRGAVVVLAAVLMVFLLGMVTLAVDLGYVALVRTQLQSTADSAALAGAGRLTTNPVQSAYLTAAQNTASTNAQNEAILYSSLNHSSQKNSLVLMANDMSVSFASSANGTASISVLLRHDSSANNPLALFFAPVLGMSTSSVQATAVAQVPVVTSGFAPGGDLLPYTMLQSDFMTGIAGGGGAVDTRNADGSAGADGVWEVKLFTSTQNTPGNFGSIDIGSDSNGTPELVSQILYGPTEADFTHPDFVGNLDANGSLKPNFTTGGDPGISNGVAAAWQQIIGQPRIIPLYDVVSGNGNNTAYHIVAFAGVAVTELQLSGSNKYVRVQSNFVYPAQVTATPGSVKVSSFDANGDGAFDTRVYGSARLTQ